MKLVINLIKLLLIQSFATAQNILPSIIWDSANPVFRCENRIFANIGDIIEFRCAEDNIRFHTKVDIPQNKKMEKIKFLGTNKKLYDSCNSTKSKTILTCDNKNKNKHFTLSIRDITTSANDINFKKGETYFFISTSYKTLENLNNEINGSCNIESSDHEFQLKMAISICKNEKMCPICRTNGCRYMNYDKKCTHRSQTMGFDQHNQANSYKPEENNETTTLNTLLIASNNHETNMTSGEVSHLEMKLRGRHIIHTKDFLIPFLLFVVISLGLLIWLSFLYSFKIPAMQKSEEISYVSNDNDSFY